MNTAQIKHPGIWLLVFCAVVVITLLVRAGKRAHEVTSRHDVTISMDAQGNAKIGGLTIGNTNLRDLTLSALEKLNMNAKVVVPRMMTNSEQASNFIEVLNSAARAGLLRDKKANPYE
jgi:hypothetical protein